MKKILFIILSLIISVIFFTNTVFAHAGKTDEAGGHYDHQSGGYHYHHGYPAHSHTNGHCPYDFDDKTDHSPNNSNSNKHKNNNNSNALSNGESITDTKDKSSYTSIGDIVFQIITTLFECVVIFFMIGWLVVLIGQFFFPNIPNLVTIVITIIIGIASIILALTTDFVF